MLVRIRNFGRIKDITLCLTSRITWFTPHPDLISSEPVRSTAVMNRSNRGVAMSRVDLACSVADELCSAMAWAFRAYHNESTLDDFIGGSFSGANPSVEIDHLRVDYERYPQFSGIHRNGKLRAGMKLFRTGAAHALSNTAVLRGIYSASAQHQIILLPHRDRIVLTPASLTIGNPHSEWAIQQLCINIDDNGNHEVTDGPSYVPVTTNT